MATVINAHEHVWTSEDQQPWVSDLTPPGVEKLVYTVDDLLADMETLGVDRTALIATPIHGRGSPYTMECLREYPDTFYGVILLDYFANDIGERVDRAFEQENLLGVRFGACMEYGTLWEHRTANAEWITSPDLDPFWEALERQTAPQVQIMLEASQIDQAEQVIAAHPDVTFVLDHLAWPTPGEHPPDEPPYTRLADVAEHSNAYVKVTHTPSQEPYPFEDVHGHVRQLVDWFGSDRLLWGTDWVYHFKEGTPWETTHFLDELDFLSTSDRRDLRYRTFETLLP
ncbi:amidohydrolase family protein [Halosimplex amylolyticum]|uniref:amidohydrolase family protein n=1 Tax=Halosimplex amylolyticum TaxID=3396616 RepID=UPI003F57022B